MGGGASNMSEWVKLPSVMLASCRSTGLSPGYSFLGNRQRMVQALGQPCERPRGPQGFWLQPGPGLTIITN